MQARDSGTSRREPLRESGLSLPTCSGIPGRPDLGRWCPEAGLTWGAGVRAGLTWGVVVSRAGLPWCAVSRGPGLTWGSGSHGATPDLGSGCRGGRLTWGVVTGLWAHPRLLETTAPSRSRSPSQHVSHVRVLAAPRQPRLHRTEQGEGATGQHKVMHRTLDCGCQHVPNVHPLAATTPYTKCSDKCFKPCHYMDETQSKPSPEESGRVPPGGRGHIGEVRLRQGPGPGPPLPCSPCAGPPSGTRCRGACAGRLLPWSPRVGLGQGGRACEAQCQLCTEDLQLEK